MAKRMFIMLLGLGILFGGIYAYLAFKNKMIQKYMAMQANPVMSVSAAKIKYETWEKTLKATGSLRAIKGVDVTTEIPGMVQSIHFKPGTEVTKGTLLVKLKDSTERAQLQVLQASRDLAQRTFDRDKAQYAIKAISKQALENDQANLNSLIAQVNEQKTIIAKKMIQAPFDGKLGVNLVNPGQYLNAGDKIVTLQSLQPIFVDFYLPQQELVEIKVGQAVTLTTDTFPQQKFVGKITTINPKVETNTRNVQVEATIDNPQHLLLPGMFGTVEINVNQTKQYLTLPQTAISFNPYGEIAYIISENGQDKEGKPLLVAKQTFVKVGPTRGDQISILEGLKEDDWVVTGGQLKLKNGSHVQINNDIVPENNPDPHVENE